MELTYLDPNRVVPPEEWEAAVERRVGLAGLLARGEDRFGDSLGWLDPEEWAGEGTLAEIEAAAKDIRRQAQVLVLIGVGGSNNGARAVVSALERPEGTRLAYMGHTLSPQALQQALASLEGKSVYVNCIAKNFETLEPGASFRVMRGWMREKYGEGYHSRVAVTGTPGSQLQALSREHGWRFFPFPPNIGGRFSGLSPVGLLPMAAAGVDIRALAEGAKAMRRELLAASPRDNLALRYACLRNLLHQKGYALELLAAFEPRLAGFFKWWIQLFAESEGKDGKGLFPVCADYSEDLHSMGQYVQEGRSILFETFLSVKEKDGDLAPRADGVRDGFGYLDGQDFDGLNRAAFRATQRAHSQKLPCLTLEVDRLDEWHMGALLYFFFCACYLSGSILGVNPFDQPGVEAYKRWMFEALGK